MYNVRCTSQRRRGSALRAHFIDAFAGELGVMQHHASLSGRVVRHRIFLLAAVVGLMQVPHRLDAQDNPLARYGIADELVLADSGEVIFANGPPRMDYGPRGAPSSAAFIMVFVVDTLGRVEMPSVSFGEAVAAPFIKAVCHALRDAEFRPVRREGVLRRALVVQNLIVQRSDMPSAGLVSSEPLRRAIASNGIVETLAIFVKQSHCE